MGRSGWHSHVQKYSKKRLYSGHNLAAGFSQRLTDPFTVVGAATTTETVHAAHARYFETIMRTALDLQRLIGEEVFAYDYEMLVVHFDTVFDAAQMDDIYESELCVGGDCYADLRCRNAICMTQMTDDLFL